ncbi:glycoside hydrolase family 140 protein [Flavilitoribacter nigricans]|uniref:Glycoside hydrolase n=1 Tax=Flavilitoribacter nigricans (strain ATCC 23147 / DSM 23189 / NBRC 102662 / NCIMB 1420 / SS-2) TaxID=1122177 RepID=A0A2D0N2S6_FLAN2|nr:glycoside hydrolase family 140 protein [Flavilitoribacter nigricans]PHN02439.1 glycoside hydrolase [Flavilitoribacter nigricans DSM 23189 = NBRC 102662]
MKWFKYILSLWAALLLLACQSTPAPEEQVAEISDGLPALKVSENHRFLVQENGDPFFWLGDTGWLLFSTLDREEADRYLSHRAEHGFNVIQVMVLHELDLANAYGDSALVRQDVSQPLLTPGNEPTDSIAYDFWDHVDYIIDLAAEKGLYMALVPVWGSNVKSGGVNRSQADVYSKWLAERYKDRSNIIWLNGGDIKGTDSTAVWQVMGENLDRYDPNHLITFHPFGRSKSSTWFHDATWLDFNMVQTGHRRYDQDDSELAYGQDNWKYIRDDYQLTPVKPTVDAEPSYENIPQGLHDFSQPRWLAPDIRRYAYWAVFAGGFGFTYGHNAVMQMHHPGAKAPNFGVEMNWWDALDAPAALQMKYLKELILSRSYLDRVPDQSIIAGEAGEKYDYVIATRGDHYALAYTYNGRTFEVDLAKLGRGEIKASWFNPRDGQAEVIDSYPGEGIVAFDPPGGVADGNDWVLVLDAQATGD